MLEEKKFDMRCGTCGRETDGWCEYCAAHEPLNAPAWCRHCGSTELQPFVTTDNEEYNKCSVCGTVQD